MVQPQKMTKPAIYLSFAFMAHPKRERNILKLAEQLRQELDSSKALRSQVAWMGVSWDHQDEGVWANAQKAWRGHHRHSTHHLVLQDDIRLCRDFLASVIAALTVVSDEPVAFFTKREDVKRAQAAGLSWAAIPDGAWGQALCLPTPMVEMWLDWCEQHVDPSFPWDDSRLCMWAVARRRMIWCSAPSLVEHDAAGDSLVGNSNYNRKAAWYIGDDVSGLTIDWTKGRDFPIVGRNRINRDYWSYYRPQERNPYAVHRPKVATGPLRPAKAPVGLPASS